LIQKTNFVEDNPGNNPAIMKRKVKQRWSTIPPISTKRTITFHLNSLYTKKTTSDGGNPGPGLFNFDGR
jgi:hypothetical protein